MDKAQCTMQVSTRQGVLVSEVSIEIEDESSTHGIRSFRAYTPRGSFLYSVVSDEEIGLEIYSRPGHTGPAVYA